MKTARALVLDKPKGRMVMGEYPIPSPAPGAILMKMELCGLCGTDVHTWLNESIPLEYPISLGHEMVGKVAALGAGVTADYVGHPIKEGDRITVIPAIHCHRCYFCTIAKTPEKCIHWKTYGTWPRADQEPHFSGGYADYLYIHDPNSVVLKTDAAPERAMFVEPMAIVVHSMLHAKIQPGDTVVVNGAGPIGLLTVALARIGNASRVIAVGVKNRRRLALAERMGADVTLCHQDVPQQAERKKFVFDLSLNLVGADVVINTAGSPGAFLESIDYVRDSGTLVEVGNFVDNGVVPFNPCTQLLAKGIRMIGSFDNEAEHFVRSLPLVSDERIPITELITHRLPLSAVQKGFEAIHQGKKLDGKEIVKIAIDPNIKERSKEC